MGIETHLSATQRLSFNCVKSIDIVSNQTKLADPVFMRIVIHTHEERLNGDSLLS